MLDLRKISYSTRDLLYENFSHQVFIEKTFFEQIGVDNYFIKIFTRSSNGGFVNLGYLYFGLDFEEKISHFVGMFVKPEFRNNGLSTLLISIWLQLCLENGIYNLETISNQRKPFIVYALKRYGFDLKDPSFYLTLGNNISICRNDDGEDDGSKYLLFENPDQKEDFLRSSIASADSYKVLDVLPLGFFVLDTVLLRKPYILRDERTAYNKSLQKIRSNYMEL